MLKKILLGVVGVLVLFLIYVSTRSGAFSYERNGLIKAPPEKIFPYLNNFKMGAEWNPYEKKDPNMKKTYSGPTEGPGSIMEFEGNSEVGSGKLEIQREIPNSSVALQLEMTKPVHGLNLIEYMLKPEGENTRFIWTMSGNGGFPMKLMSVFVDCEKMVTADFEVGIQNLKTLVESKN